MEREQQGQEEPETGRFIWRGSHFCLDFVNTQAIRGGQPADLLETPADLAAWLGEAGLISAVEAERLARRWAADRAEGDAVLERVRAFRGGLRRMLETVVRGGAASEDDIAAINGALRGERGYRQVVAGAASGAFTERFVAVAGDAGESDRVLAALAETASDLLCQGDLSRVRVCESPRCILFFYDTSKNRTRRWCSMAACGNRMKAAAHFQRTRKSG